MTAIEKIERLKAALDEHDRIFEVLNKTIGLDIDGALSNAMFAVCNVAVVATAESVGVDPGSLDWFVFENHFGAKKHKCQRPNCEPVIIDSIGAFLKFEEVSG
jgi:hypothetical protein